MRSKKILVPALGTLLLTGAVAGTAFAERGPSDGSSGVSRFVEILAGKLGVGEEELQTAVEETKAELQAEREAVREQQLRDKLAAMVEGGKITQEQADEYLDRYLNSPELAPGDSRGKPGFGRGHSRGKWGGAWGHGWKSWDKGSGEASSDAVAP